MFVDVLPRWERRFYWIVGIFGMAYSIYILFLEGEKRKKFLEKYVLLPGWMGLGRYQDQTDVQWFAWRSSLHKIIILNVIHVLLSQICFYLKINVKIHSCVLLTFDFIAAFIYYDLKIVLLLLCMTLIMYAASMSGSKSCLWLVTVPMMYSAQLQVKNFKFSSVEEEFLVYVMIAFFQMRLISFTIDKIQYRRSQTMLTYTKAETCSDNVKREQVEGIKSSDSVCDSKEEWMTDTCHKKKTAHKSCDSSCSYKITNTNIVDCDPSFLDLLFYSFYLPTFIDGPILIYKDFHNQVKTAFRSSSFTPDVYDIVKQLIRLSFWAVFIEFQFHFLYYNAFGFEPQLNSRLSVWALAAICYCQGQFMMLKYVVIYGSAIQFSRFDGLVPLAKPQCITFMHTFKYTFKCFDVGMYNFIKTYIYVPLGGSKGSVYQRMISSGLGFIFICLWHGHTTSSFIYCLGNYIFTCLEVTGICMEHSSTGIKLKSYLSPAVRLRLKAIFVLPFFIALYLQTLQVNFNVTTGKIFLSKLITEASWTTICTEFFIVTACVHNSIYLTQWYACKQKKD